MFLYKLTNRKTGLSYIGATPKKRLNDRLALHRHRADEGIRTSVLHEAIRTDGWDSFEVSILARPATFDDLMAMEQAAIAAANTLTPHGYNMTAGGIGQWKRAMTPKNKAAISAAHRDQKPWNFGLKTGPMSAEACAKMSEARMGRKAWNKGVPATAKHRALLVKVARRGGEHHSARPLEYEGVIYACVKDACAATGLTKSQMIYRLQTGRAKDLRSREN